MEANKISDFSALEIPKSLKAELKVFCEELLRFFKEKIVSITIVGSAATTDFSGKVSDINILCVFSDLYLIDLRDALPMINKHCNKNRFSPRFITKNNLISSSLFPYRFMDYEGNTLSYIRRGCFGSDKFKPQRPDLAFVS